MCRIATNGCHMQERGGSEEPGHWPVSLKNAAPGRTPGHCVTLSREENASTVPTLHLLSILMWLLGRVSASRSGRMKACASRGIDQQALFVGPAGLGFSLLGRGLEFPEDSGNTRIKTTTISCLLLFSERGSFLPPPICAAFSWCTYPLKCPVCFVMPCSGLQFTQLEGWLSR